MKKKLIRNGKHERPILAVLKRYGIGSADTYDRGIWITEADISLILEKMPQDPSYGELRGTCWVDGTNQHNSVTKQEILDIFK